MARVLLEKPKQSAVIGNKIMAHNLKGLINDRSVLLNGKPLSPIASQAVYNHSPDGFNWGYGGSGPAQLALAVLLELYGKEKALGNYQSFKWKIIANISQGKNFDIIFNDL